MNQKLRIALVCEGNASTSETAFSGTAKRIFNSLQLLGHEVIPVDASLHGLPRALAALASVASNKDRWRSRFRYGAPASGFRSRAAARALGSKDVDVVLQIGATYTPPRYGDIPYALYCDWNMALTTLEAKARGGKDRGLSLADLDAINRAHGSLYRSAAAVLTISERLRASFIDLYGLAPEKVYTAYAGPNIDVRLIDDLLEHPGEPHTPTVLFIAKEFIRKGGDTVASAMRLVQQQLPTARLLFAGTDQLPSQFESLPNVEHLGILDKNNPRELLQLLTAYRNSDVFVLPSRRDPFPTVIREAMFFGLPCVASNIWAMPEMIEDKSTGLLVPPDEPDALAKSLLEILSDPEMQSRMGKAARRRAETMFSWSSVGDVLSTALQACVL